jgi:hypothetical protein
LDRTTVSGAGIVRPVLTLLFLARETIIREEHGGFGRQEGFAMGDSKIKGGHQHQSGAVKLDPNEPGVNMLPDGKIAVSEQVVQDIVDHHESSDDH